MFCNKCGKELINGAKFCLACGNRVLRLENSIENSDSKRTIVEKNDTVINNAYDLRAYKRENPTESKKEENFFVRLFKGTYSLIVTLVGLALIVFIADVLLGGPISNAIDKSGEKTGTFSKEPYSAYNKQTGEKLDLSKLGPTNGLNNSDGTPVNPDDIILVSPGTNKSHVDKISNIIEDLTFEEWQSQKYPNCLRTCIAVKPEQVKKRDVNNIMVLTGMLESIPIIIVDKNDEAVCNWKWLYNVHVDSEGYARFNAVLEYSGEMDEHPVFFFSEIEEVDVSLFEETEEASTYMDDSEYAHEEDDNKYMNYSEDSEYIYEDAVNCSMSEGDLEIARREYYGELPGGRSLEQMIINEIYARHGYIFNSDDLNEFFGSKSWYRPRTNDINEIEDEFGRMERDSIDFLKSKR